MIRRFLFSLAGCLLVTLSTYAYESTKEISVGAVGTPTQVTLTTYSWTCVGCTKTLTRRGSFSVTMPIESTGNFKFHWGNCTSTSVATTTVTSQLLRGNGFTVMPMDENVCVWGLTTHTATETVGYQELRQ